MSTRSRGSTRWPNDSPPFRLASLQPPQPAAASTLLYSLSPLACDQSYIMEAVLGANGGNDYERHRK